MNALVYHVASGQAFFSGVAMILASLGLHARSGRWLGTLRVVLACAGLIFVGISSTPVPLRLDLLAYGLTLAWLVAQGGTRWASLRVRGRLRWAVLGAWGLLVAMEAPWHVAPRLPRSGPRPVYVVGDSLAAGLGQEGPTWPDRLSDRLGVRVENLARVGAGVKSARTQADLVTDPRALVVVEIGGNDVLSDLPPEEFEAGLDALLARLRSQGRTIVLLELPLPPFHAGYGSIQRRLVRRYGVSLVPKRVLLGALTGSNATIDSLHLSPSGHDRLASALAAILRPALTSR